MCVCWGDGWGEQHFYQTPEHLLGLGRVRQSRRRSVEPRWGSTRKWEDHRLRWGVGAQILASSHPQHIFRRRWGCPALEPQSAWRVFRRNREVSRDDPLITAGDSSPGIMKWSIFIYYIVLDPHGSVSFLLFPLLLFLWPPSFFLAPRFQEQPRPLSSFFGPGALSGAV